MAFTDGNLIGDPIEKQAFEGLKFKQSTEGTRVSTGNGAVIT